MAGEAVLKILVEDSGETKSSIPVPPDQPPVGGIGGASGGGLAGSGSGTMPISSPHGTIPATAPPGSILNVGPPPIPGKRRRKKRPKPKPSPKPKSSFLSSIIPAVKQGSGVLGSLFSGGGAMASIGGAAAALGGVAVAGAAVAATFGILENRASNLVENFSKYSGQLSEEGARQKMLKIQQDMLLANKFSGPLAGYQESMGSLERALDRIATKFLVMLENSGIFKALEVLLELLEILIDAFNYIISGDWIPPEVAKILGGGMLWELIKDIGAWIAEWRDEREKKRLEEMQKASNEIFKRLFGMINAPEFQPGPVLPIPPVVPLGGGL